MYMMISRMILSRVRNAQNLSSCNRQRTLYLISAASQLLSQSVSQSVNLFKSLFKSLWTSSWLNLLAGLLAENIVKNKMKVSNKLLLLSCQKLQNKNHKSKLKKLHHPLKPPRLLPQAWIHSNLISWKTSKMLPSTFTNQSLQPSDTKKSSQPRPRTNSKLNLKQSNPNLKPCAYGTQKLSLMMPKSRWRCKNYSLSRT